MPKRPFLETVKVKADSLLGYAIINKIDYEANPDDYELIEDVEPVAVSNIGVSNDPTTDSDKQGERTLELEQKQVNRSTHFTKSGKPKAPGGRTEDETE